MPVFEYKGYQKSVKKTEGTVDAETIIIAKEKLLEKGVYPFSIQDLRKATTQRLLPQPSWFTGISQKKILNFTEALETFLNVTYLHSKELMWSSTARFKAAKICEQLEYYDDAIKLYQKIAEAYKGQIQGDFAKKKLEELNKKHQGD